MKNQIEAIVLENTGNLAKVKTSRHGDCSNCGSCPGDNALILDVVNEMGAKPGQHIVLEVSESDVLKAAFIVYVLPLICAAVGAFSGYCVAFYLHVRQEPAEILAGFLFFIMACFFVVRYDRALKQSKNLPSIIKIIQ